MDAITPKAKHDTLDTHSHVVRPAQMEWKKTRFPGCEVKGLLFDKESGVVTALMKFAPGAVLPDHEHVKIEQTYVLEGKLVDKEGPAKDLTVGPGEFVWREAGSRHVACTPEGGLMLAMFQVPNKFYEQDGRDHRHFRRRLGQPVGAYLQGLSVFKDQGTKRSRTKTFAAPIMPNCGVRRSAKGTGPCCETSSKPPRS